MPSLYDTLPENPVYLAEVVAQNLLLGDPSSTNSRIENYEIGHLDYEADVLGFIGMKYFLDTRRSLSIPVEFERDQPVKIKDFNRLMFDGEFVCYSKVVIGQIVGAYPVSALCASFDKVTILPYFESIPEDHLLHVPVLAVTSISKQAA